MAKNKSDKQTAFQKFVVEEIHRSQIKNAPYNPRQISDDSRRKLRDQLGKVGLVQPICWNRTTGHIVGGHQRIAALDELERSADYTMSVAVVEVDLKVEKELNVFLNNTNAQGDWDLEKLNTLLKDADIELENTGFDLGDVYQLFGESPEAAENSAIEAMAEELRKAREANEQMVKTSEDANDPDFYCVVVFKNYAARKDFTEALSLDDNRYIDGGKLKDLIKAKSAEQTSLADER
jgi:ParB-like chromosome segregation protein Spo0J